MKQTPLNHWHKEHGARMVPFAGWEMPVRYSGVIKEHTGVRGHVGLFDISHMGEILVTGPQAKAFVDHVTTNDFARVVNGQCQYALLCRDDGGIVDDIISYQFNPEKILIVVNAATTDKDFDWLEANNKHGVALANVSSRYFQCALQGPRAREIITLGIKPFRFVETVLAGLDVIVSRTGYTGEDGFEIYGPWEKAQILWEWLLLKGAGCGIEPAGLAARDTLRLEAALSLYGHELSDTINPLEAGLERFVKLDKKNFIGKKTLERIAREGPKRRLIGLNMREPGIPREGFRLQQKGRDIGRVTSGTYAPTLKKAIALGYVEAAAFETAQEITVDIRGRAAAAAIVPLPFYKRTA